MAASDNLFIGDLPPDINEETVTAIFSAYGGVTSCKAMPAKNGGSKGAALVRFATTAEAQWVLENLNGNMPEGLEQPVVVSYARSGTGGGKGDAAGGWGKSGKGPQPGKGGMAAGWAPPRAAPYPQGKGGGKSDESWGGGGGDFRSWFKGLCKGGVIPGIGVRPEDQCLYIKNLPTDTTDQCLYELFSPFGPIAPQGVKAMLKEDGTCTSVGFVDFQDAISAQNAMQALNGTPMPDGQVLHMNIKKPKKGGGKGAW